VSACAAPASGELSPLSRFTLSCARTDEERARATSFRRQVFLQRRNVVFDELLEARRDREGHLFLLTEGSVPVATARVLPYPSALSPVLGLGQELGEAAGDSEVGRIAAARSADGLRASLIVLTLGSLWVVRNTRHRRYVAYCHPKLVELYRTVGAQDLGISCSVPGRSDPHRIVAGTYERAAALGARLLGVTEAQAARAIRFDGPPPVREERFETRRAAGSSS
jgi:hypothetical protein